ncbi:YbaK/EbsC family protein [Clostridium coskatii]|uniref:Cys-tRNA(Pro)/Cys-tRNA(Cys) deacylase YbaK n=1 Tax=Clostridium coskatii TaxID=1705578 RepID=A0A162LF33_9CLOT|nr:YbaK/EbsC family protein [Clostridium coskatii]OAA94992.1 Cys-tRNA(Pro)/Cys-tRNA(Cys) deacylase YbaK [Clostridium coskatii]OBR94301.1 Cys-tRNA(Pro)/Cys-tRNA(Cys) deacylase YbaK [Clostridium coskatii]
MSLESVKQYFKDNNLSLEIIEMGQSTATVELAANALGVEPALIAKTMAFKLKDRNILILSEGDAKIDNRKFKDYFHTKAKMLSADEVLEFTGHPVGGVCPFGLKTQMDTYLDESLKKFEYVYPAAGSRNSAVKITPEELSNVTSGTWVDVCK